MSIFFRDTSAPSKRFSIFPRFERFFSLNCSVSIMLSIAKGIVWCLNNFKTNIPKSFFFVIFSYISLIKASFVSTEDYKGLSFSLCILSHADTMKRSSLALKLSLLL